MADDDHVELYRKVFEEHGVKVVGSLITTITNLALTPILRPVEQITEFLRSRTEMDYTPLLEEIFAQRSRLTELL